MFLISNVDMVVAACQGGATAAFPALNYRTDEALREAFAAIRTHTDQPFGVNLIVNKSNYKYAAQLETLLELKPAYIITSLGNPKETIEKCKPLGIKVFCDVIDAAMATKVAQLGADAVIAVNNQAGGHCGNLSPKELIASIQSQTDIPIISAGGIGTSRQIADAMNAGAIGVSVGTVFLASTEATISPEYKQALIDYTDKDIVLTTKMSGSHLTVINTPYVQKIGTKATFLERLMHRYKFLKKYIKLFIAWRGIRAIEKSAFNATYDTVWCAGPSIAYIHEIRPLRDILHSLTSDLS